MPLFSEVDLIRNRVRLRCSAGGKGLEVSGELSSPSPLPDWQPPIGICPSNAVLLRQTICRHLRRSRPETILNVFQRIRLRFFRACGLASTSSSLASQRRITWTDSYPLLIKEGETVRGKRFAQARGERREARGMGKVCLVSLVCLVHLVCLVSVVR
jgi:hypothetical protein